MTDGNAELIERLRARTKRGLYATLPDKDCIEAVDALEALQAELARMGKETANIGIELREGNMMLDNEPPLFVAGYERACNDYSAAIRARVALKGKE